MQIHHITPQAADGQGDYDNGIPLCLDCHAEVSASRNMGRQFSSAELRLHRDRWFTTVREHPEVLLRASQTQADTGPLEAMLAELDYIKTLVSASDDLPPLPCAQFERAIATNAVAALRADSERLAVHRLYGAVSQINQKFDDMAHMERSAALGVGPWARKREEVVHLRKYLVEALPNAIRHLESALGAQA
jgi:hypothetical protein